MKCYRFVILILFVVCGLWFGDFNWSQAQTEYQLLAPIPLAGPSGGVTDKTSAGPYIAGIFKITIATAGILAVIMIIYGGIKYMSTDAFSGKGEAKGIIENAIWGLILTMAAWIIVYTIDPNLVRFDLNITRYNINQGSRGDIILPVDISNCSDCVPITVPHKSPARNGCASNAINGVCTVSASVNSKLENLYQNFRGFEVTESFPPTRVHRNPCHQSGACVDAALIPRSNMTRPAILNDFVAKARAAGFNPEFEVPNQTQKDALVQAGFAGTIIVVAGVSPHFSMY